MSKKINKVIARKLAAQEAMKKRKKNPNQEFFDYAEPVASLSYPEVAELLNLPTRNLNKLY